MIQRHERPITAVDLVVEPAHDPRPDAVVFNAQVLTVDRAGSVVEALAVKGDRVVATGSNARVLGMAGPGTRRLDVGGRTVVPGFIDTHAHLDREGLGEPIPISRRVARSPTSRRWCVAPRGTGARRVGRHPAAGQPPYHLAPEQSLAERRFPDRHDLDAAAPANPSGSAPSSACGTTRRRSSTS